MANDKVNTQKYAMHYGTIMGIFWIVKFIFFPLGLTNPVFILLFFILTIAVPFIGFHFAKTVRDNLYHGHMSFLQSWVFLIFMYMFAALLTAVAHYIYFRFVDNGFIIQTYLGLIDEVAEANLPGMDMYIEQFKDTMDQIQSMTAIELAMQLFTQNILYCSLISLITAFFVGKKKPIITPQH